MSRPISAVIPVRNNAADLPLAVASVVGQPNVVEVLLCVGPSHDDSMHVAHEQALRHGAVRVLNNDHGGIPQALNLGLSAARGELLLRLDAHSILPSGYVENAVETMARTKAVNVGAVQRPVGQTLVEQAVAGAMAGRAGSGGADYRHGSSQRQVDTAFLGFFEIDALRAVGGWDESFARNEDAELNIRLSKAGGQIWLDPMLVVDYRPRGSLRKLASQYFHYGWWRFRTIRKHPGSLKLRQLAAPLIVLALLGSIIAAVVVSAWALVVPALYVVALIVAGLASTGSLAQRVVTAAALGTMHLSWGTSFLLSAVRSLVPTR